MTGRTVGLIWAQAANGVIGRDGGLPWRLPEDLAHFRAVTAGATVVMGRRTWESIAPRFRPLPGRRNLVLTRRTSWHAPGAETFADLAGALAATTGDVWVIGGAGVYAEALAAADALGVTRLEVTELADAFEGDVTAPAIPDGWAVAARDPAAGWHTADRTAEASGDPTAGDTDAGASDAGAGGSTSPLHYRFTRWQRDAT